jgi:FlaA1/EpsC-like NDP-sugar epimerase
MFTKINLFVKKILILPRVIRKFLVITLDFSLCILCTWLAFYIRLDVFTSIKGAALKAAIVSVSLALPVFWLSGLYRTIYRYSILSIMFTTSMVLLFYVILNLYQYICTL